MENKNYRCFVLYSHGLDSQIAAHLMNMLGYDVTLLTFRSEFFNRGSIPGNHVVNIGDAELNQIVIDVTARYLELFKAPKFGFGKNLNPCVDCKILFLSIAKSMMDEHSIDFLVTGEVIGQRPKSQKRNPLNSIIRDAQVKDILVRPLSISHFEKNKLEIDGIINRNDIMNYIQAEGRNRKPQMEYAEKFNIGDYNSPSGGCLLTYKEYCRKLRPLLQNDVREIVHYRLLKTGRHFILKKEPFLKFIAGRNKSDNEMIESEKDYIRFKIAADFPGPSGLLLHDSVNEEIYNIIGNIMIYYSDCKDESGNFDMIIYYPGDLKDRVQIAYNNEYARQLIEDYRSV